MCHSKDASNFCVCVFKNKKERKTIICYQSQGIASSQTHTQTNTKEVKKSPHLSAPTNRHTERTRNVVPCLTRWCASRTEGNEKEKQHFSKYYRPTGNGFFFFFFFANINGNDCRFSRGHWGRHHLQKLMPIFHLIRFEAYYTNTLYILCVYNQTGHRTTPWDGNWGKKKREDKDGLQAADGFALIAAYERNNLLSFLFLVVVVVGGGGYLKTGEIRRRPLKNGCHGSWCLYT